MVSTTDAWSAELESAGQVVFPQRRKRLWIRAAVVAVFFGNSVWSLVDHIRADDMSGLIAVLRITSLGAFVYLVGITIWQLITRRPVVTVNHAGIQIGKSGKSFFNWQQIARIDDPPAASFLGLRGIQVQPVDRHRLAALGITHDNVLNLTELAAWLRTVHTNQSQPSDD
jgi:hypothetical protein